MLQHKSMYAHTHIACRESFSLTPKYPHNSRVDTKQLKILPAHMSGILWVQLLSPEAASASLRQQNSGPHSQSHTITVFINGRAVNESPAPHHNPAIASIGSPPNAFRGITLQIISLQSHAAEEGSVSVSVMQTVAAL